MKFYGNIGFGESVDLGDGVWDLKVTERLFRGDVIRNSQASRAGDKVLNDLTVGNSISVISNDYMLNHLSAIKYVVWKGVRWIVVDITFEPPRLVLRLGGVYNGPTPGA